MPARGRRCAQCETDFWLESHERFVRVMWRAIIGMAFFAIILGAGVTARLASWFIVAAASSFCVYLAAVLVVLFLGGYRHRRKFCSERHHEVPAARVAE